MKNYDVNMHNGTHDIKVTFQLNEFKGYLIYSLGGSCKGYNVLSDFDMDCFGSDEISGLKENNANVSYDEDYDVFSMELTDENGDTLETSDLCGDDVSNMIVSIEIVDFY